MFIEKIRPNLSNDVFGAALRGTAYIHTHGEETRANNFTDETYFIRILESEFWEKRISNRASDFPTKCLKTS